MPRYASGKKSKAISDITGFKVPYTSLRTTYDNLRVEKEEFDPKHPQLTPAKNVVDATALFQPRPDNAQENVKLFLEFNYNIFQDIRERPSVGAKGKGNVQFLSPSNFSFGANVDAQKGTGAIGTVAVTTEQLVDEESVRGIGAVGVVNSIVNEFVVTVASGNPSNHPNYNVGSTNKYAIGGSTATADVVLDLVEGNTYRFDQSDSSNGGHPLRFTTDARAMTTTASSELTEYTTGVTTNGTAGSSGAYTEITVASGAPTLYYYCTNHSAMGATLNTPAAVVSVTLTVSPSAVTGTGTVQASTTPPNATRVQDAVSGTGAIGSATNINIGGWGGGSWDSGSWDDG